MSTHSDPMQLFAENLRYLRTRKKLTQETLANEVGLAQPQISEYERKITTPHLDIAMKICDVLGVSIGEMLDSDLKTYKGRAKVNFPEAIKGARYQRNPGILTRYENMKLYCYYYSGENEVKLREGYLELDKRYGVTGSFISGRLKSWAQEYICKLVIEHPSYIYVFGDNDENPERMFMVFHEPKHTKKDKPYRGGIGICVSEGSNKTPYVQKIILSSVKLDISVHQRKIDEFLRFDVNSCDGYRLSREEDSKFYAWQKGFLED